MTRDLQQTATHEKQEGTHSKSTILAGHQQASKSEEIQTPPSDQSDRNHTKTINRTNGNNCCCANNDESGGKFFHGRIQQTGGRLELHHLEMAHESRIHEGMYVSGT